MKNRGVGNGPLDRVLPVAIAVIFVAAVLLLLSHSVGAQGANVQIRELECDEDPEVVVIVNEGDQDVDLNRWRLQSDPTREESLELGVLRTLSPQESVLIESGPSATAAFIWSREFVFRDNDPTDLAQLVNAAGEVVVKVKCGSVQQPTATATPVQTAAPSRSPTPTGLPADAVPFGGGPPAAGAGVISPAAMIVTGGWLFMAGVGTFAVPLLHRGKRSDLLDPDPPSTTPETREIAAQEPEPLEPLAPLELESREPPARVASPAPAPASRAAIYPTEARAISIRADDRLPAYLALVVIVLVLVAVLVFRLQGGGKKRE